SAQIREILISESAWEEMTCLFAPSLEVISTGLLAIGIICTVPIMARWKKLVLWQKTPVHNTR
ncbi:hypothetical protein PO638_22480, partial [Escherichia coli]